MTDDEIAARIYDSYIRLDQGLFDALDLVECLRCRGVLRHVNAYDHLGWHDWLDGRNESPEPGDTST